MKIKNILLACGLGATMFTACTGGQNAAAPELTKSGIDVAKFDTIVNEKPVKLYTLTNENGMEVCITNYGGRIVSVMVPAKDESFKDVVLGYDNIEQYLQPGNFGAAIGRYGNRIGGGKFKVGDQEIQLTQNNYGHCLHGGNNPYDASVFDVKEADASHIVLTLKDEEGKEAFPGNVDVTITYTLTADNALDLKYEATTDKETIVNLTNHSYFNVSGDPSQAIDDLELYLNADNYTPVDATFMTTGEIVPVKGTLFDFTTPTALGKVYNEADSTATDPVKQQIFFASGSGDAGVGIDHNFCLNTYKDGKGDFSQVAASVYSPASGILMEMYTDEPGVQVYTGNFLAGENGKNGISYQRHASICLETQKYPDSPNKKDWPQPYLKPGETYTSHTAYKFSVK